MRSSNSCAARLLGVATQYEWVYYIALATSLAIAPWVIYQYGNGVFPEVRIRGNFTDSRAHTHHQLERLVSLRGMLT